MAIAQVITELQRKPILGQGLLRKDLGERRTAIEDGMAEAISGVMGNRAANHRYWRSVRDDIAYVRQLYESMGLGAPPLNWEAFWRRIDLIVPPSDGNAHAAIVTALQTDCGPIFSKHVLYRLLQEGNVHIRCFGPTGSGKSSCMITLMHWIKTIPPGKLEDRLAVDIHDVPAKLTKLEEGDTVMLDELFKVSGEGAATNENTLDNIDDSSRQSQRNLIVTTPRKRSKDTLSIELGCFAWNPPARRVVGDKVQSFCPETRCNRAWCGGKCPCGWRPFSVFFVWMEGVLIGVLPIEWCTPAQKGEYNPIKANQVRRTLNGQFKDNMQIPELVMELCANEKFVEWLWLCVNKPGMGDINSGIRFFWPGSLTDNQTERAAKWAHEQLGSVQRLQIHYGDGDKFLDKFQWFFGVRPNKGFLKLATKYYEE